jgi:hypothetical protein
MCAHCIPLAQCLLWSCAFPHTHKYVSEFRNRHAVVMVLRVCCQVALLAGGSDHGVIKVTVIRTYHGVAVRQKVS